MFVWYFNNAERIPFKLFPLLHSPSKLAQGPTLFTFNHRQVYDLRSNVDSRKLSFSCLSSIPIIMWLIMYENSHNCLFSNSFEFMIQHHSFIHSFIHSFNSTVLQQVRRLFQRESSLKCDLVLPLTISSILSSLSSCSSCLGLPLLLLFTSFLQRVCTY
jgi:hypothetical protein